MMTSYPLPVTSLTEVRTGPEVREWPLGLACPPHSHVTVTAWGDGAGKPNSNHTNCLQVPEVRQRTPRCRNGISCTDSSGLQRQNLREPTPK